MNTEISQQIRKYYDSWFEINRIYSEWAKKHDISQKALFVLYEIFYSEGYCTQVSICEHTSYQKQTVSQIIKSLEKKRLVTRSRNELDKRNHMLRLSPEGELYAKKLLTELHALEVQAFEMLQISQRKTVVDGFHLLSGVLHKSFQSK